MSTIVKTRSFFIRIANRTNSSHAGNQGAVKNPDPERQALVHSKGVVLTNRYLKTFDSGPPPIMPYGRLRMPYVTIRFVPYAISCIFFKGMSYGTNKGGLSLTWPSFRPVGPTARLPARRAYSSERGKTRFSMLELSFHMNKGCVCLAPNCRSSADKLR